MAPDGLRQRWAWFYELPGIVQFLVNHQRLLPVQETESLLEQALVENWYHGYRHTTPEVAEAIRADLRAGGETQVSIAKRHGVAPNIVSRIKLNM